MSDTNERSVASTGSVADGESDRPKPINAARLAALEELSALDQALELQYGLTGNPMIKAQGHTPVAVSASCPRCGLTFSETVDSSSFTADEIRAVQCGANAMRVAARRVSSYDDQRDMELMADQIEAMLHRLG